VFSNLLENALSHGAADTPIHISLSAEGDEIVARVQNDGEPIAPERLDGLLGPHRHGVMPVLDPTVAHLGLGLFISERLVVSHGGRLEAQSSAESGTIFCVRLPRCDPAHGSRA
jgi:signal transduction histidine kinase